MVFLGKGREMLAVLMTVGTILLFLCAIKAVRRMIFGLVVLTALGTGVLFAFSWANANFTSTGALKSQLSFPNPFTQVQASLTDAAAPIQTIQNALDTASSGFAQLNQILPTLSGGAGSGGMSATTPSSQVSSIPSGLNSVSSVLGAAGGH